MNKFRIPNDDLGRRSVDGFVPSTPKIGVRPQAAHQEPNQEMVRQRPLDGRPRSLDGFQTQKRLEALPTLPAHRLDRAGSADSQRGGVEHSGVEEKPKKRRNIRKILKRTSLAMTAFVLLFGGYFGFKIWWNTHKVLKGGGEGAVALNSEVDPTLLNGEGDGRVNILVLGKGGPNHPGGDLTDSILIASIDPLAHEAALLSVPRDLWVKVPDYWSMKINAVYSSGKQKALSVNENDEAGAEKAGIDLLEGVLEQNIGIPIHYYVMVNFTAFKDAVDAVGGVDVDVKEALYDGNIAWENNNNPLIADVGLQHFDGKKALLYARSRYTSSDFARGERQRELTVALKEKVLQLGTFSNPVTVSKLIDAIGNNVTTSLSLKEIMRVYEIGKEIPSTSIASLGFTDEPNVLVKTGNIDGQSVVIPRRGQSDFSEIQSFVRNALRDGFLKSENASVVVLNGTDIAGLATKRAEELKSFGYNVTMTENAPAGTYPSTQLIDLTDGIKKYTKRYLEQRLGATATASPEGLDPVQYGSPDFIIIIGDNEASSTTSN